MEPQEGRPPDESGVGGGARAETPSSSPPAPSPTSPAGSTGGSASGFNTRGLAREEVSKLLLRKLSGDVEDGFEPLGPIATASNLPAVYQALAVVDTPVQLEVLSCLVVASTHSKVSSLSLPPPLPPLPPSPVLSHASLLGLSLPPPLHAPVEWPRLVLRWERSAQAYVLSLLPPVPCQARLASQPGPILVESS